MPCISSVRMRPADSRTAEFHLLEELFKPRACLSSGRIAVWVYHDGPTTREVVISGHAEGRTCASATSILIEAAKQLGDNVQWMLTCGAAYFRLSQEQSQEAISPDGVLNDPLLSALFGAGRPGFAEARGPQAIFGEMIQALQELADEKGLVEIIHQDWQRLAGFRGAFQSRVGASPAQLVLPNANRNAEIADYLPIIPGERSDGEPLIFKLEGWDFDCPAFQLVADLHLRKVQRELLGDALRRRRTYRGWLKEWTENWIPRLSWLPKPQAAVVALNVPAEDPKLLSITQPATVSAFLNEHAAKFLDRGQVWHKQLAYLYSRMPFGQLPDSELDQKIRPDKITEVDFERGKTTQRKANESDAFTWREKLLIHDPQMISHCLLYIRRMDWIIKPYEELRLKRDGKRSWQQHGDERDREVQAVDEISRRIVVETMVRGWPSFYLEDKSDSAEFDAWAAEYRSHVWAIIAKQAKARGVALDILLEDNIVYDVRFNDELGCTIQPLMLVDDATHAQLHASRTGASVVLPLWSRLQSQAMPDYVLRLGANNRERARQLLDQARRQATEEQVDSSMAAESLRLALACHPAEAGKLILQEWSRRLGRDTSREFQSARNIVNAAELLAKEHYAEAGKYVENYLNQEEDPVPDAFVISAIIELGEDESPRRELQEAYLEYELLAPRHEELASKLRPLIERASSNRISALSLALQTETEDIPLTDLERLMAIQTELERLGKLIKTLQAKVEKETNKRRRLIERALDKPTSVHRGHPALALAAKMAGETLKRTLESDCRYREWSEAMLRRYGDIRRIIEARGLLDILHRLSMVAYRIDQDPSEARLTALDEVRRLSSALWLPSEIESDLRHLAEEFGKGDWDRLQTLQIVGLIRDANTTCLSRMQDLLSSSIVTSAPLKETIATQIHVTQTIDAKYKTALDMLLTAKVPLGGATSVQWIVGNDPVMDFPEGGQFIFDAQQGVVFLVSNGKRTPLLTAVGASDNETEFIAETFADPSLPFRLNRFASSLAEALLATEIEPCREWRVWRDAMSTISRELIAVLSNFRYEANLMPEHAPPVNSDEDFERRMNEMIPRSSPKVDWDWSELGAWSKLAGHSCRRTSAVLEERAAISAR